MKAGQHMTEEQLARHSIALLGNTNWLGHHHSEEAKAKIAVAMMGRPGTRLGCHTSDETKTKQSAAAIGRIVSPETRAKLSVARKGKHGPIFSSEARAKIGVAQKGKLWSPESRAKDSAAHWKGGPQLSRRRCYAKRRGLGYVFLNAAFPGCEGHHVDDQQVINEPRALHRSIYHCLRTGQGMAQSNAIAYNFLFKQEVEAAIKEKST